MSTKKALLRSLKDIEIYFEESTLEPGLHKSYQASCSPFPFSVAVAMDRLGLTVNNSRPRSWSIVVLS